MNKEELQTLREYATKKFSEAKLDIKNCKVDSNLTLKQNIAKIDEQIKTELYEIEQAEIKERQKAELDLITADSKELDEIYDIPNAMLEKVCEGKAKGLLLYGETSLGKSHKVKEVLKKKGKKPMDSKGEGDYLFVSGHITPMKFYERLYECKDKIIVFDDCDILGNIIILNMIKASLNENSSNVVDYHTSSSKMTIPSSFVFSGQVIILLNQVPDGNPHLRAIASRIQTWELKFTRSQIVKIIHLIAHKGNNEEFKDTTEEERVMVAKWLTETTTIATTNLNIRLFLQAVSFYKWDREHNWKKDWKRLTTSQFNIDNYTTLIIQGITNDEWVIETGLSVRTLQRKKKEIKRQNDTDLGYVKWN